MWLDVASCFDGAKYPAMALPLAEHTLEPVSVQNKPGGVCTYVPSFADVITRIIENMEVAVNNMLGLSYPLVVTSNLILDKAAGGSVHVVFHPESSDYFSLELRQGKPQRDGVCGYVMSRSISPHRGSIRFRPLICMYPPWGVRVDELAKSRKIPLLFVSRSDIELITNGGARTILTIKANNISRKAIQAFAVNTSLRTATLDPAKDGQPDPQCQASGISDDSGSGFAALATGLLGFNKGIEPQFTLS